jgi:hypothetical protein
VKIPRITSAKAIFAINIFVTVCIFFLAITTTMTSELPITATSEIVPTQIEVLVFTSKIYVFIFH